MIIIETTGNIVSGFVQCVMCSVQLRTIVLQKLIVTQLVYKFPTFCYRVQKRQYRGPV